MSSSPGDKEEWVPYSERGEWKDVNPVKQPEDDNVVRILYTDRFKDIFEYFRAVFMVREVSERAFLLTTDAAEANPSNYTVWHYRRFLLRSLKKDLEKEMSFCREIMEENPKCYQIWEHRKKLVETTNDPSKELRLTEIILSNDSKNYHAWQHRLWVVRTYKMLDDEFDYVERLLEEDVRNNSAWNHRCAVLDQKENGVLSGDVLKREIDHTVKAIEKVHANESSWSYLTMLLEKTKEDEYQATNDQILKFIEKLNDNGFCNAYLLGAWIDLLELAIEKDPNNAEGHLQKISCLIDQLIDQYDIDRCDYWKFVEKNLSHNYGKPNKVQS